MARPRNVLVWNVLGALLALVLPVLGTAIAGLVFPTFVFDHLPLHSLVEGAGGLIALAIAGILLAELGRRADTGHYPWMAAGFMSMGVLDLFHAASRLGNHFIWLHCTAVFAGGVFFGLIWITSRAGSFFSKLRFPLTVAIMSVVVGGASILFPRLSPLMRTPDNTFSTTALTLNMVGGMGFLAAGAFFARRFCIAGKTEDWLFGVQSTLFGAAGVLFAYSVVWDGAWWWWHVLRLAAYVAALFYGLRTFREAERELRRVNRQLIQTNDTLDARVRERTQELRSANEALHVEFAERERAQQALREAEERSKLALKSAGVGTWNWDVIENVVYWDDFIHPLFGLEPGTFPGLYEEFLKMVHIDDRGRVRQEVARAIDEDAPFDTEYKIVWPDSSVHVLGSRAKVYRNGQGQILRMTGVCWDITERKRLAERFRLAVEASPVALITVHQHGHIVMANSRSATLFGYSESELLGQPVEILVPERVRFEQPTMHQRFFEDSAGRAMGNEMELVAVRKDGSEFPVRIGLSPVETAEGLAVICGVLNITDEKSTLEAMRQAKEAAEMANRAKSSFLANMSHEIRTPMNGIIGMSQLLAQTELRSHQRDYLATVEESAHILLRLLNDILDFSKIEAGKLELESVDFCISECVARASQMLILRAAEKGLELACRIAPEIPDHLRGDAGRLQQVLVNLLSNAVKFTEAGEVFVNVNAESITQDRVRLHISVSDTGIGIPADKLDQIFRPFEQAESSTTRRFGGSGLGLTISRQLVEMMHGRMWVESELGRGSTFHITAELEVSAEQQLHASAELDSLRDLPVLVVDDNLTNRRILSEILQHWNMQPVLADSASAARLALQTAVESQQPIRLILLDHHMPSEDGLQFAESVRESLKGSNCPIIMISSGAKPMDEERCQKYGIDRFMAKPIIASELLNEVLRQFGHNVPSRPPSATASKPLIHVSPRRVLLVEDNAINRRVALGLLRSRGHQVVIAENGQEAVDTLAELEFDVVLMDMQMPVMDGYEATQAIRTRERQTGGHIPIVAMTAEALKGDRERCLAVGMDDYVAKPISPVELYRVVERFPALCLHVSAEQRVSEHWGTQPTRNPLSAPTDKDLFQRPTIQPASVPPAVDWNVARKRLVNDVDELREFAELARSQVPTLLADIRQSIESRDFKLLRRAVRTLRGSINYFGAQSFVDVALKVENLAQSESLSKIQELLPALENELASVVLALEAGPPNP